MKGYHCLSHIPYSDKQVIEAYLRLGTQDRVRDELGISHTTVYRILKRNGIQATGRKRNGSNRQGEWAKRSTLWSVSDEQIIADADVMTKVELCKKYSCSISTIKRRLQKLGVKARPGVGYGSKARNYKERAMVYDVDFDESVTLDVLYDKSEGRCAICGETCNFEDITENGGIGRTYPTIDHIIPLSKGGTHTWDNVQLAHNSCNSRKGVKSDNKPPTPKVPENTAIGVNVDV